MNGRAILLTRPVERARETLQRLEAMGAEVVALPLIQLRDLESDAAQWLSPAPDCIAFTSPSAVESFVRHCAENVVWQRWPAWAVGAATAHAMRAAGFEEICESERADGASLAQAMRSQLGSKLSILLPGARIRRPELPAVLRAEGHELRIWDLYETLPLPALPAELLARFRSGWRPLVLLYSPSAVDAWQALGELHELPADAAPLALFGPTTARRAGELGLEAEIAMGEADEDRFLEAIDRRWISR